MGHAVKIKYVHIITYVFSLMIVLHVKFHVKIRNGFLSHVLQKQADRKKDNSMSNEFQPPLMFCAHHVTRFFIQYNFIFKSESKFVSQYPQVRVCNLQKSLIRFTNNFFNSILIITDFCYMFRKKGRIERSITLWATNFSPPHFLSEFPTL